MFTLHQSQWLFWLSCAFLAGVAGIALPLLLVAMIIVLAGYRAVYKQPIALWVSVLCLAVCGGFWWLGQYRYQMYLPDTSSIPYEQSVTFTGMVTRPPQTLPAGQKLFVSSDMFSGKVYIKTGRYPIYAYGDELKITCTLHEPEPFDTFAFDKYLARYGVYSICSQANLTRNTEHVGHPVLHVLYALRDWMRFEIKRLWPEPVASLLLGVILGIQDDIPDDIVNQFRTTGTVHILVVSGMHVMIIAQLLSRVGLRWFSRKKLFWIVVLTLIGFCVITGLAASVVRASIMGVLPLIARAYGRRPVMHYSLVAVATAMVAWNPYILQHDVGFQLSFLATVGLVYFQSIAERACWWLPEKFALRETLSTTLAATIATTPLILSVFGMFSVVSPLANLMVVPVSTFMLFAGTVVIIFHQIVPWLSMYWAYDVWQIVTWMLQAVDWLSRQEFALIDNILVPEWFPAVTYSLLLIYIIWRVYQKSSVRFV